ncbi:MAG: MFS transporter [Flavisolibacter sp.]
MYAVNYIDRQIVTILAEPIKRDLHISDTQLGLLSGTSFAFLYVILAIPVSIFADKSNRRNIITGSLVLWSLFTMMCGLAGSFISLLLIRVAVGIGEAGGSAPATAMISDYFPPKRRATALSIFTSGIYIGITVGLFMGGWLSEHFGWRKSFFLVGFPGIIYGVILFTTVKEPLKGYSETINYEKTPEFGLLEGVKKLLRIKTFLYVSLASGFSAFVNYASGNWMPSFFARNYGLRQSEIGSLLAITMGISGAIACILGGFLSDKLAKTSINWYLKLPILASLISIPFYLVSLFSHSLRIVAICTFISRMGISIYIGPVIAVAHLLVPAHKRAFSTAVLFFILNSIGLGLGPVMVGWASDSLKGKYGGESIKFALACLVVILIIACLSYHRAGKYLKREVLIKGEL